MDPSTSDYSSSSAPSGTNGYSHSKSNSSGTQSSNYTHSSRSGFPRRRKCSPKCPHGCGCSRSHSSESDKTDGSSSKYHIYEFKPRTDPLERTGPLNNQPQGNNQTQNNNQNNGILDQLDDGPGSGGGPINFQGNGRELLVVISIILIVIVLAIIMFSMGRRKRR